MSSILTAIQSFLVSLLNRFLDMVSLPLYLLPPPSYLKGPDRPVLLVTPSNPATVQIKSREGYAGANGDAKDAGPMSVSQLVQERCPSLQRGFTPSWWLDNGHLQTIFSVFGNFTNVDKVVYERTLLRLPDGGTISLDSTPIPDASAPLAEDVPTILVAHGLTGGSHESYVRNVLEWVVRPKSDGGLGGRGVVVNYRGCANTPVTSPQSYSGGYTGDYHTAACYLADLYPSSPLIGLGFSLGAGIVSRYMGEQGSSCVLTAGIALAAPWDYPAMSLFLEGTWLRSRVYSNSLGGNLLKLYQSILKRYPEAFELPADEPADSPRRKLVEEMKAAAVKLAKKGSRIRLSDIDENVTCKMGGLHKLTSEKGVMPLEGAVGYYNWASPKNFISGVKRPLLAVNAFDDPIVFGGALPIEQVQESSHVVLAVSSKGGHLGWFDGPIRSRLDRSGTRRYPQQRWIVKPVTEFIVAVLDEVDAAPAELKREVLKGADKWCWVKGSEDDLYGRVGWLVVDDHAGMVEGADESGALQGL